MKKTLLTICLGLFGTMCGCASDGKPSTLPNPDANLRKTSSEFAADAAKRDYEATAPKGGEANARAQYQLMSEQFDVVNLSDTDWSNVEVWVNQKYVVMIPAMQRNIDKKLDFQLFFDKDGHHFSTDGGKNPISSLEIYRDGKMYTVPAVQE